MNLQGLPNNLAVLSPMVRLLCSISESARHLCKLGLGEPGFAAEHPAAYLAWPRRSGKIGK